MRDRLGVHAVLAAASVAFMAATLWAAKAPQTAATPAATDAAFFEAEIRPLLSNSCYDCHTEEEEGDLRLDSREAMIKGGKSGPAIVPGDPDESRLIKAVRHAPGVEKMPRKAPKLSDAQIATLAAWIKSGAPWPASTTAASTRPPEKTITADQRAFWSFQPLRRPAVPAPARTDWAKTDIDRFILARLESEGLAPVRAADKLTLIRRATLDLTGLPPTPEEIDAFEKDAAPDAFAKVVDRLLASPRYGEAWGRLWLDVARYGEDDYRGASIRRVAATTRTPTRISIATGSSRRSTTTCRTTSSSRRSSPPICSMTGRAPACCPRSASSASVPGTTTTAPWRSRAPTSGTIAWTS